MRVCVVDSSAYTWHYDHALCTALAARGASVELATSRFAYGETPPPAGYALSERFYRHARGPAGSRRRRALKLAEHGPDMARLRAHARMSADVVHFQWLTFPWLDRALLPDRPLVLTAHDLLPRERPLQTAAQRALLARMDALVVHSEAGRRALVRREDVPPEKVHVIRHGAYAHIVAPPDPLPLPAELAAVPAQRPVVLFFGLLRPYKGIATLLQAWRGIADAELWVVGRPMMDLTPLRAAAPPGVRFLPGFVPESQIAAYFARAALVALPYARTERFDFSGVLATALASGTPVVLSDIGGFAEVAATGAGRLVAPDDPAALHDALAELLADDAARARMSAAALRAAETDYSWDAAAERTLALYASLGT